MLAAKVVASLEKLNNVGVRKFQQVGGLGSSCLPKL